MLIKEKNKIKIQKNFFYIFSELFPSDNKTKIL